MTGKTFLNRVADGRFDAVRLLPDLLRQTGADYCVVGGPGHQCLCGARGQP